MGARLLAFPANARRAYQAAPLPPGPIVEAVGKAADLAYAALKERPAAVFVQDPATGQTILCHAEPGFLPAPLDASAFAADYKATLAAKYAAQWGTGGDYDLKAWGIQDRESIPVCAADTVARMMDGFNRGTANFSDTPRALAAKLGLKTERAFFLALLLGKAGPLAIERAAAVKEA